MTTLQLGVLLPGHKKHKSLWIIKKFVFNATFNNIVDVLWWSNIIGLGIRNTSENHRSEVYYNLYHIMLYQVHLAMRECMIVSEYWR